MAAVPANLMTFSADYAGSLSWIVLKEI